MRRVLLTGMVMLAGCGGAVVEEPVDTTLPNGTAAIASSATDMTTDLNATDGMGIMSDNMTVMDDPYPPSASMLDGMTDPYATAPSDAESSAGDGDADAGIPADDEAMGSDTPSRTIMDNAL